MLPVCYYCYLITPYSVHFVAISYFIVSSSPTVTSNTQSYLHPVKCHSNTSHTRSCPTYYYSGCRPQWRSLNIGCGDRIVLACPMVRTNRLSRLTKCYLGCSFGLIIGLLLIQETKRWKSFCFVFI